MGFNCRSGRPGCSALIVDLADAVATEWNGLFDAISVEMVFRGLYHFTQIYHRGEVDDPVLYLVAELGNVRQISRIATLSDVFLFKLNEMEEQVAIDARSSLVLL